MQVSYSRIQTASQCPRKYYWRYVKKLRPVDDPADKSTGTLLHRVLAASWGHGKAEPKLEAELLKYEQELLPRFGPEETAVHVAALHSRASSYLRGFLALGYVPPPDLVVEQHHKVLLPGGNEYVFIPDGYSPARRELLEIKTGVDPQPDKFLLYSIQHYAYAYGLALLGMAGPWYITYLLIGARKSAIIERQLMAPASIAYAGRWLNEWRPPESTYPNYGQQCQWCEYNLLDESELAGLPVEDVFGHYTSGPDEV